LIIKSSRLRIGLFKIFKIIILVHGTHVGLCEFKYSKNLPLFKESGEDMRVSEEAGVEPPEVSPVSAKRKKAGRRSSGIWRYFSDIPTGMRESNPRRSVLCQLNGRRQADAVQEFGATSVTSPQVCGSRTPGSQSCVS
jgi:hypothetical protein